MVNIVAMRSWFVIRFSLFDIHFSEVISFFVIRYSTFIFQKLVRYSLFDIHFSEVSSFFVIRHILCRS